MQGVQQDRTYMVLALLLLVGIGLWILGGGQQVVDPNEESLVTNDQEEISDSAQLATETGSEESDPAATDRQRAPDRQSSTGTTSLRVRFIDRATGLPVANITAMLTPKDSVSFAYKMMEGASDAEGEILWENLSSNELRVYHPYTSENYSLEPGLLNERVQEVDLTFTIIGRVEDANGQPVSAAEIWAGDRERAAKVAESDDTGSFTFPVYDADSNYVYAQASGQGPSRTAIVQQPEGGGEAQLHLQLGEQCGSIIGRVVTPEGQPIQGASVRARGSNAYLPPQEDPRKVLNGTTDNAPFSSWLRTDSEGEFRFDDLPIGEASVNVMASGWAGTVLKANVVPGGSTELLVTMSDGGRIIGLVRDSEGSPVEGVTVVARYHTFATRYAITDNEGEYAIENVEPGFLMLHASHPLRGDLDDSLEIADGQELRWEPVFGAGLSIRGQVLHAEGAPMVEGRVMARTEDGERRTVTTDSEGRFLISHAKDQDYLFRAYPEGFPASVVVATDVRPSASEWTFRLPSLPAVDASVTGVILGPTGEAVVSARILGRESEFSAFTMHDLDSPDGRFTMGPILSGKWSLQFDSGSHPRLTRELVLAPGETKDLGELRLGEAVPVAVTLLGTENAEGNIVCLLWGMEYENERVTVASGLAQLPPMGPGEYRLEVFGEKVVRAAVDMELVAGRDAQYELRVEPGVSRSLGVELPKGTDSSRIRFQSFDANEQELVSWTLPWYSHWGSQPTVFRPEAVRIVATSEEGLKAEANLGAGDVRLVMR